MNTKIRTVAVGAGWTAAGTVAVVGAAWLITTAILHVLNCRDIAAEHRF